MQRLLHYWQDPRSRATGVLFFVNAFFLGNWTIRLPELKARLAIDDGEIGLALLAMPLGVILFAPVTTWSVNRYGTGRVALWSAIALTASFTFIALPQSYYQLIAVLFVYGLFSGVLDVSMNGLASAVEKLQQRSIMSTSHGCWSLGAMVGSLAGSGILGLNWGLFAHFALIAGVSGVLILFSYQVAVAIRDETESALRWVWPGWRLTLLIFIVFLSFMTEGGIVDWNAIFYDEVLDSPAAYRGFGFAAFAGFMAIARFGGDVIMARYGASRLLLVMAALAALGLLLFIQAWSIVWCTVAMGITGLACSILVPIVFQIAGNTKEVPPSLGLALASTLGYTGLLLGPPLFGFVSEARGLTASFGLMACFMVVIAGLGVLSGIKKKP